MRFTAALISGVVTLELERYEDERGFFARTFCQREFEDHGLNTRVAQCSLSFNPKRGTLRGMHYQVAPHEEARLVRCIHGAIYDVIIDMRPLSLTFRRWVAVELSAEDRRALYVPEGVAHGFETLVDDTEVFYQISEFYDSACARGVRWDDPSIGVTWPLVPQVISQRDASYLDLE